ncbi:hypothetical protein [Faecalibaculum rodentium]|uniref:hypothetical protein n=1 Tax=Faecalibaculum rodentium TaxID=1702221 RepID=UPI0023F0CEBC|nr:hypothetical protein [Faecalibaculum rodentium]
MANVIAVIWDFDKTLINGYMQDPIFKRYNVNGKDFWIDNDKSIDNYLEKSVKVNKDTFYLNNFINQAKSAGKFEGLNNAILRECGGELEFFPGVEEFFKETKNMFQDDSKYSEYNIHVEHYIVSTGFAEEIRGSTIMEHVEGIWGCELIESDFDGKKVIGEVGYTIDNTTKTRAIFEINKGINKGIPGIDVNSKIPEEHRRVPFNQMIYIADGPSDVPAFSVVNKGGGYTFAVYPKGDKEGLAQVEQLRADGRVKMYSEADYSSGTLANMLLKMKIQEIGDRIYHREREKLSSSISSSPKHII